MRAQRGLALKEHVIASYTWRDRLPQGILTLPNPMEAVVQEFWDVPVTCLAPYHGRVLLDPVLHLLLGTFVLK